MKNVAFVTYNTVGDELASGWHERDGRRALVLQNTKGDSWCVDRKNPPKIGESDYSPCGDRRRAEISTLWIELHKALPELDHVVVYVGARGSERAIELASTLPAPKVTFVSCDCGLARKVELIVAAGLSYAGRVDCECGGRQTMRELFEGFMQSGELVPVAA